MTPRRILFISNHLGQPRHARRVNTLEQLGFQPLIAGYMRGVYEESGLGSMDRAVRLRQLEQGRYLARAISLPHDLRLVSDLVARRRAEIAVIWCFGLDSLTLGALLGSRLPASPRLILELGDLRGRGSRDARDLLSGLMNRTAEWLALRIANGVVLTSPAHKRELQLHQGRPPVHVALNKLPCGFGSARGLVARLDPCVPLRIGVIGLFRYPEVLRRLIEARRAVGGEYEIHFFGDGGTTIVDWIRSVCRAEDACHYHGPYQSPADLSRVYGDVDLVWSVYDSDDGNVRTAIPNKLFEATWFGRPLIVSVGTALARMASEMGAGFWTVDSGSVLDMIDLLRRVRRDAIERASRQSLAVADETLVESPRDFIGFLRAVGVQPRGVSEC